MLLDAIRLLAYWHVVVTIRGLVKAAALLAAREAALSGVCVCVLQKVKNEISSIVGRKSGTVGCSNQKIVCTNFLQNDYLSEIISGESTTLNALEIIECIDYNDGDTSCGEWLETVPRDTRLVAFHRKARCAFVHCECRPDSAVNYQYKCRACL